MRLDKQSILCDNQALTRVAEPSDNVIDLGKTGNVYGFSASAASNGSVPIRRRIGSKGQRFLGQISETVANLTSVKVDFLIATNEALTAGTETVASVTLTADTPGGLNAGAQIPWPNIPRYLTKRYFGLRITGAGGSGTVAGKITAGFVEDVPDHDY